MKCVVKKGFRVDGKKEGQTVEIANQAVAARLIKAKMVAPVQSKKN